MFLVSRKQKTQQYGVKITKVTEIKYLVVVSIKKGVQSHVTINYGSINPLIFDLDLDSYDFFPQVKFHGYQWAPL